MEFTAQQIAQMIGGRIEGDPNAVINAFAKIEEGKPGAISFLSNEKYTHYIYDTQSSVVLINDDVKLDREVSATLIRVKNAYEAVAQLLQAYESMKPRKKGIDPLAFIAPTATVGDDCYVGAFAYIGEGAKIGKNCQIEPHAVIGERVTVGDDCIVYSNAVVYHDCRIGSRVTLHAGSVIGADGFGFAPTEHGYDKIPQIGNVVIEDDVEIGANSCVDRSTMGSTYVRKGVKIDNLVQIAHNTDIGQNTVMSAQVGVAGSTKIGEWCMFGGQVGIAGHITIGNRVNLGAQSGAPGSIKDNQTLLGTPPMDTRAFFRSQVIYQRLPQLYKEFEALKKQVESLSPNPSPKGKGNRNGEL
ncbi:MAG: UDP-3-O-(3-hydroxymyristoyl)glucosamine N-acyltransferase [Prevotella sp.]|nr:UDP-3-O-(3-hydroxymyristoyl)glucosamine N-acyltransferase [Prevotella sp.]